MKWIVEMTRVNEDIDLIEKNDQIEISKINGRTQIVFKKANLKGKVLGSQVLQTLLVAAQLQGEYLIKKLSRGSPLDSSEVKQLKDLAEIAQLEVSTPEVRKIEDLPQISSIKETILAALTEKLTK